MTEAQMRKMLRDARPETDHWRWTGDFYEHRRDTEVRLELRGRSWVMTWGGSLLIHEPTGSIVKWTGSHPASILPHAASEAEPLLCVEVGEELGPDYDGNPEVTSHGL